MILADQVPEGWTEKTLNDLVEFLDGKRRPIKSADRNHIRGSYPYYGASGIIDWVNDYLFDEDLILLGEDGENILSRNLPLAFAVSGKIWVNNHAHVLRPKVGVDLEFLTQLLEFQDYADLNSGTAQPKLNLQSCKNLRLSVPASLHEQQAIAAALSDTDGVVAGLERVIAKKRLIKQGAMQGLLTARRRLPGFSGEWEVKRLGSVLKMQVGFPFSSAFFSPRETGPRLVRNRDLRSDDDLIFYSGAFSDQFLLSDGDILIGMDGDFSPTIWSGGTALLNQRVGRLKALAKIDLRFCYYVLQDELKKIESVTSGTTVKHLSHYDIEKIAVHMPDFDEQQAIAAVLSDMDAEIQTLESRLAKARAVKEGMMQNLLTGRVRLV